jgi:hypothetical protein
MALLDVIKQNLSQLGDQRRAGAVGLGTTAAAEKMIQAGTGKAATTTTAPVTSTIGEQLAVQQTQQELAKLGDQAQLATADIEQKAATQQSREQLATEELNQKRSNYLSQYYNETSVVLSQLERERSKMTQEEQIAKLEQVGFNLALADDKYIYGIQDQGRRQRLDDETGFRIALQEAVNADMLDLFEENVEWQKAFDMSEREYTDWIASLDLNKAIELAAAQERADRIQTAAKFASTAVSVAAGAYENGSTTTNSDIDQNQYNIGVAEQNKDLA